MAQFSVNITNGFLKCKLDVQYSICTTLYHFNRLLRKVRPENPRMTSLIGW